MSFNHILKKYLIKIPNNIKCLYCDNSNILIIKGSKNTKIIKPIVTLNICNSNYIYLTSNLFCYNRKFYKKSL